MNKTKELLKNTFVIFVGKIFTQLLTFLLLPIYTGFLNPTEYGYIDLAITYIQLLVPIIILELDMGIFRFLIDSRKDKDKQSEIISSSLVMMLIFIFSFILIYMFINVFLNIEYMTSIFITIIVNIILNIFLQISRGIGNNTIYSIASSIVGTVTIIMNLIFIVFFKLGAISILYSMIISNIIGIIYLIFSLRIFQFLSIKKIKLKNNIEILKYSIPLIPNLISWWIINVSDRSLISYFLGMSYNGLYAVATKFPSIINSLFGVFSLSWTEFASLYINDKDKNEFFSKIANNAISIFSSLSICLIGILPIVFKIFIKEKYYDAYNQIPILVLGSFFSCVVMIYSAIYVAKKLSKKVAMTSIYAAIINVLINLIFINSLKLYAASLSTAIAYFCMTIYRHFDSKKYVLIKYDYKVILLAIIGFTISFIIYYLNDGILSILFLMSYTICFVALNKNLFSSFFQKNRKK